MLSMFMSGVMAGLLYVHIVQGNPWTALWCAFWSVAMIWFGRKA